MELELELARDFDGGRELFGPGGGGGGGENAASTSASGTTEERQPCFNEVMVGSVIVTASGTAVNQGVVVRGVGRDCKARSQQAVG